MPILIKTTDEYLYVKKRDILVLQLKTPNSVFFSRDDVETQRIEQEQLSWFKDRGIESYRTCDPSAMIGWFGEYYIDVDPADDLVERYTDVFETTEGKSKYPERYQMVQLGYQEWVDGGGMQRYEQLVKDLENPDYKV